MSGTVLSVIDKVQLPERTCSMEHFLCCDFGSQMTNFLNIFKYKYLIYNLNEGGRAVVLVVNMKQIIILKV